MAKGKGKKSKNKPPKLTYVADAFYRLTVADCEKKIERLSKHLENLDVNNNEIKLKIHSLNYEQVDKAADLTKNLRSYDDTIYKYNEDIHILSQEVADMKSRGDATIADLEDKYKAMHDQLTAEIKLLKAKLQILEDFRDTEDKLKMIIENEKELLKDKNEEYKNVINNLKVKIQAEKDGMKKEIESRLVNVSEEFTHSTALRDAAYAQRLIRENIALEKEIDILESSQQIMEQQLKEKIARCKEVRETFPALNRKKRLYILEAQNKTNLIDKLTTKYEKLRNAFMDSLLYKNQYQDLVQYQLCKHQQKHQLVTKAKKLAARAHKLKSECHYLEYKYECHEKEKARLRDVMLLIRKTILAAVNVNEDTNQESNQGENKEKKEEIYSKSTIAKDKKKAYTSTEEASMNEDYSFQDQHQDSILITALLNILEQLKVELTPTGSLESVTPNSFLQQHSDLIIASSDSLREPFKHLHGQKGSSLLELKEEAHLFRQDSKAIFPRERMERCLLFDVEKGTSFYASSVKTKSETIPEEQEEFREQESSSYDSFTEQEVEAKQSSMTRTQERDLKQKVLPPGTIVDVEFEEEEDEEGELNASENEEHYSNYYEENNSSREPAEPEEEMSIYMFY